MGIGILIASVMMRTKAKMGKNVLSSAGMRMRSMRTLN